MTQKQSRWRAGLCALLALAAVAATVTVQDGLLTVTRFTPRPGIGTNRFQIENTNAVPVVYFITNNGGTLVTSNSLVKGQQTNKADLRVEGYVRADTLVQTTFVGDFALVSDPTGEINESTATAAELGHLSGVTGGIQTNLAARVSQSQLTAASNAVLITVQTGGVTLATGPRTWNFTTGLTGSVSGTTMTVGIAAGGASFTGTTNWLLLKPTAAKMAATNSAYADNSLQSGFLAYPHTNGVGTVIALAATFDQLILPNDYATNTLALDLFTLITATNGPNASNVIWQATVLRHNTTGQTSTNDAQVGPFDAGSSTFTTTWTAIYTGTNKVQLTTGTITNCTLAAGESFSLKLERLNANAADLIGAGVAGVTAARLRYTRP